LGNSTSAAGNESVQLFLQHERCLALVEAHKLRLVDGNREVTLDAMQRCRAHVGAERPRAYQAPPPGAASNARFVMVGGKLRDMGAL